MKKLLIDINKFADPIVDPVYSYDYKNLAKMLTAKELLSFGDHTDIEVAQNFCTKYDKAMELFRHGKLEAGYSLIINTNKKAEEILENELFLYAKQHGLSVLAYFYYKKQQFKAALAVTLECLALNEFLYNCGCTMLIYRCLSQNENIAKIYLQENNWKKGVEIIGNILDYQINNSSNSLCGTIFRDRKKYQKNPLDEIYMLSNFKYSVFLLIRLTSKEMENEANVFNFLFGKVMNLQADSFVKGILKEWILLSNKYLKKQYGEFVEDFLSFMGQPINSEFDVLKLSLCQNLIFLIKESEFENKNQLLSEISSYVNNKLSVKEEYKIFACSAIPKFGVWDNFPQRSIAV